MKAGLQSAGGRKGLITLGILLCSATVLVHSPALGASAEENFRRFCAQCHGFQGKGDGVNASHMDIAPKNLTDAGQIGRRTAGEIARIIEKGGTPNGLSPLMPPWGNTLSRAEINGLVKYIYGLCQCGSGSTRKRR